jgi:hypothetical protein
LCIFIKEGMSNQLFQDARNTTTETQSRLEELPTMTLIELWCAESNPTKDSSTFSVSDTREQFVDLITAELFQRHIDVGTLEFALRARSTRR